MVFKLASSVNNATAAPPASGVDPSSVMTWSSDCDEASGSSQAEDDQSQSNASSDDYETSPSADSDDPDDDAEGEQREGLAAARMASQTFREIGATAYLEVSEELAASVEPLEPGVA